MKKRTAYWLVGGTIVGTAVVALWPREPKWTPLELEIIAHKGATDAPTLKKYGATYGKLGAAAACVGLGAAPAAVGCGLAGGFVGGIIGKAIPIAKGSSLENATLDAWKKVSTEANLAYRGIFAVKAYLTLRKLARANGYSESELTAAGFPPAPVSERWRPSKARYNRAQANWELAAKPNPECATAKKLGIVNPAFTCQSFNFAMQFQGHFGPIAAPGDALDWFAVGRDERAYDWKRGGGASCDNWFQPYDPGMHCPDTYPSALVEPLIAKLNTLKPKG